MNHSRYAALACAVFTFALAGSTQAAAQNEQIIVGSTTIRGQAPVGTTITITRCSYEASKENIDACTQAIKHPSSYPLDLPQAYAKRGAAYMEMGKFREAVADFDQALIYGPNADVYNNRCFARARMDGVLNAARSDCEKSLKLEPGKIYALDSLAFVSFKQGDYVGAIAAYDGVLAQDPNYAPALYIRGVTKVRRGDFINGHADINAARRADPQIARTYFDVRPN